MKIEKEIKELIEKNLPEQVGVILKDRLQQAEQDAKTVKEQKKTIEYLEESVKIKSQKLAEYATLDERNKMLEKREKALDEAARRLDITALEIRLKSEEEKTAFVKDVTLSLVRNTEYRRSVYSTHSEPDKDQYGFDTTKVKSQETTETTSAQ